MSWNADSDSDSDGLQLNILHTPPPPPPPLPPPPPPPPPPPSRTTRTTTCEAKTKEVSSTTTKTKKEGSSRGIRARVGQEEEASTRSQPPYVPPTSSRDKAAHDLFPGADFASLPVHPHLVSHLQDLGMGAMTRAQVGAIPPLLQGRDVLIKADTGSGKTLAYLVPLLHDLQAIQPKISRADGTYAIVLAPTRELCVQIGDVLRMLCRSFVWIVPGVVVGGEKRKSEKARLRKGVAILVATPGRLLDHFQNTASLNVKNLRWFVFDEADRLMDMGFEKSIREILSQVEKRRIELCGSVKNIRPPQTALVSATLPPRVTRLASLSLRNPVYVDASSITKHEQQQQQKEEEEEEEEIQYTTPEGLTQYFSVIPPKRRLVALIGFIKWKLHGRHGGKIIVFFSNCAAVEYLYSMLVSFRVPLKKPSNEVGDRLIEAAMFKLHGNLTQRERADVYAKFCALPSAVLLCTDVAARGLDLPAVDWIVQYDAPIDAAEYVHRVGRTARIGHKGSALLFLLPREDPFLAVLAEHGLHLQRLDPDLIFDTLNTRTPLEGTRKRQAPRERDLLYGAMVLHKQIEEYVNKDGELLRMAKQAYNDFIKSYATHPKALKNIFHVRNLHLGHIAKSFALQDTPSKLTTKKPVKGGRMSEKTKLDMRKAKKAKSKEGRLPSSRSSKSMHTYVSEFSAGDPEMATTKKKRARYV